MSAFAMTMASCISFAEVGIWIFLSVRFSCKVLIRSINLSYHIVIVIKDRWTSAGMVGFNWPCSNSSRATRVYVSHSARLIRNWQNVSYIASLLVWTHRKLAS